MSFLDEFKKIAHPYEEDEDEELDGYEEEMEDEEEPVKVARPKSAASVDKSDSGTNAAAPQRDAKVVSFNANAAVQLQVVLVKPETYDNASEIADHLTDKKTVVMNLEKTDKTVARRLLDFMSGVAYANRGKIQRVAASTYIVTPFNVEMVGDLIDELENNGLYY